VTAETRKSHTEERGKEIHRNLNEKARHQLRGQREEEEGGTRMGEKSRKGLYWGN